MAIRTIDITNIDTTGVKPGANLIYSHGNTSFEWVSGTFTPTYVAPNLAGYTAGSAYGYDVGGSVANSGINRYPFTADTDATDVGELIDTSHSVYEGTGTCSTTYGYVAGGNQPPSSTPYSNNILRFPFTSPEGVAGDVGELTYLTRLSCQGISDIAGSYGYNVGNLSAPTRSTMNRYPTVSPGNATDVGELATGRQWGAASSSETVGYVIAGEIPADTDTIEKFPFASNSSSTQPATLLAVNRSQHGHQGQTHIYVSGGISNADVIQKFTYAADTPATDVGELANPNSMHGGTSATSGFGYLTAGYPTNVRIEKFSMISDGGSSSVGNLAGSNRYRTQGNIQV